ncbi:hypothetical protein A8990_13662 [Paenibacillus taihuensis]|uniref:Uncharacterized protein n=1 Tax=Paenibacillus taihuensis TaxID=1156355 RepID=A0A3D9R1V2_9BACL|nr:hypothetical protein [Paenibacillus taihuensis]REE68796.1 hypothetical protein A8990_13662 [Paenibacillus taihuensis]
MPFCWIGKVVIVKNEGIILFGDAVEIEDISDLNENASKQSTDTDAAGTGNEADSGVDNGIATATGKRKCKGIVKGKGIDKGIDKGNAKGIDKGNAKGSRSADKRSGTGTGNVAERRSGGNVGKNVTASSRRKKRQV